jgi:hypothetical protein
MRRSLSRASLVGSSVMALALAFAGPASAGSPNGGCGDGLTRITIPDLLAWRPLFPPAYAAAVDQNRNDALCYLTLPSTISPSSPEFGKLIVVDDRGPARD